MGENTGFFLFLWIVCAPTLALLALSLWAPRKSSWEVRYGPAPVRRETPTRYSADDSNLPL